MQISGAGHLPLGDTVDFLGETRAAIGYRHSPATTDPDSPTVLELAVPRPGPHGLLVRVHTVSVKPVDVMVRAAVDHGWKPTVLGYVAVDVVQVVGPEASLFDAGHEVYYAGPGANSECHTGR